jgi:hypothetical protein
MEVTGIMSKRQEKTFVLLYLGWYEVDKTVLNYDVCYIVFCRSMYSYISDGWIPVPDRDGYFKPRNEKITSLERISSREALKQRIQGSGKHIFLARPEKFGPPN